MHSLYNIAKADFLQRIRSLSFLAALGVGIYLTISFIPAPYSHYSTVTLGNYQGFYTSSWMGTMIAMMSSIFLSLIGFYLVNNSIDRDYRTGVGQIIATTKVTKFIYITGKALSNFFILLSLMLLIALTATGLALAYQEFVEFSALDLYLPFIWITLPSLVFIASFSAFLECFRKINRGLGNILFLFLFVFFVAISEISSINKPVQVLDLFGTSHAFGIVKDDLEQQVKDYNGQHSVGYTFDETPSELKVVTLGNLHPGLKITLYRFTWIVLGIIFMLIASRHFKRFDPAFEDKKPNLNKKIKTKRIPKKYILLPKPKFHFGMLPMVKAESKLMLKGLPVWWWFLTLGLYVATVFADLEISHKYILPLLLLLQINIWSVLGSREKIYNTQQIVFTTPRVLSRQLFAGWSAGFLWAMLLTSAVLIRLTLEGHFYSHFAVITGIIFIISLALTGGIFSGGTKLFQVIYFILFYGLIQEVPFLDYLGTHLTSYRLKMSFTLLGISLIMLILCWIGRRKQCSI